MSCEGFCKCRSLGYKAEHFYIVWMKRNYSNVKVPRCIMLINTPRWKEVQAAPTHTFAEKCILSRCFPPLPLARTCMWEMVPGALNCWHLKVRTTDASAKPVSQAAPRLAASKCLAGKNMQCPCTSFCKCPISSLMGTWRGHLGAVQAFAQPYESGNRALHCFHRRLSVFLEMNR